MRCYIHKTHFLRFGRAKSIFIDLSEIERSIVICVYFPYEYGNVSFELEIELAPNRIINDFPIEVSKF